MKESGMEMTECAVKDLFEDRDMALLVWMSFLGRNVEGSRRIGRLCLADSMGARTEEPISQQARRGGSESLPHRKAGIRSINLVPDTKLTTQ